jgi:hypothetical protein
MSRSGRSTEGIDVEITNALLVAMMFVVLLTMGIGNIVTALSVLVDRRSSVKPDAIHTTWVILLLLVYLNLFWHVLDIMTIEDWTFLGFLYIVSGAIVILFATQVLLPDSSSTDANDLRQYYRSIRRQFFLFIVLLQVWIIGVDFVLGNGFTGASAVNVVFAALALALMASRGERTHQVGTISACVLFLAATVARGLGVIH